ncbi:long-chain fatty acid--CoA ligase [Streptosporangiaceae bacterium NEAU-GS5]|nr:long-chain fatty acid--CoA ligase [Streptosporangiaceae bacterium NEAU-GS5]
MTTLPELLGRRDDGEIALVVDGERPLSVARWRRRAEDLARRLPSGRVAVLQDDWIEYAVACLAVHLAGGTVIGLSPQLTEDDVRSRLDQCAAGALLRGGTLDVLSKPSGPSDRDGTDGIAEIIYTSGTTGRPKPVAVPHANLTFGHEGRGKLFDGVEGLLAAVPLGTNGGHSALMTAITAPTATHVLSRPEPANVARLIAKLKVGMAVVPPAIMARIVAYGWHERYDLSSLTALMLGSAPVSMATVSRLRRALPETMIVLGYGSTEAAPAFVSRPIPPGEALEDHLDEHLGKPSPGTRLQIVDAHGAVLPPAELGEIRLRSDAPQRWYFGDPEASERVFADGWTRMGDLGQVGEDGRLRFFDRARDVIVRDGVTVSSSRVENALQWHPEVVEAAVLDRGGKVVAAVLPRATVPVEELARVAADHLDPSERPDTIVLVDRLPHGPIGKVIKRELAVA